MHFKLLFVFMLVLCTIIMQFTLTMFFYSCFITLLYSCVAMNFLYQLLKKKERER